MTEQATLKMALDSRDVEEGAKRVSRAVQETGEHGHKSFVHAGSAAKGFHKTLERITESSPVAGRALQLALSPMVGLFGAAAAAIGVVHEKMKELDTAFDRAGKAAEKPFGDAKERARETAKAVAELRMEQDKYARSLKTGPAEQIEKGLKESLSKLDAKAKSAVDAGADPAKTERTRLQLKYKMEEDALKATSAARMKATEDVAQWERIQMNAAKDHRIAKSKEAIEAERGMREQLNEEIKRQEEAITMGYGKTVNTILDELTGYADERHQKIKDLKEQVKASEKRSLEQQAFLDQRGLLAKAAQIQLDEAKERRAKLNSQFGTLDETSAQTLKALRALPTIPGQAVNAPTRDAMLGVSAIQERIDAAQRRNQESWVKYYRDNGMIAPEQNNMVGYSSRIGATEVSRLLQQAVDRLNNGVPVFGRE